MRLGSVVLITSFLALCEEEGTWASNSKEAVRPTRPNVLLIVADDHRYDWMGHKQSFIQTPNLDALARSGWSFPNAFCSAGVSSPARAGLLTGRYSHQASAVDIVWQNNSFLYLQEMFPQLLHREGYRTGYIGKFHLGEEEKSKPEYDLWASFPFVGKYYEEALWVNGKKIPQQGFTDDNIAAFAANVIRQWGGKETDRPFCLIVGLKSPHIPFEYPERMKKYYQETIFQEPETFLMDYTDSKPGLAHNLIDAKKWPHAIPKYGSFQEWVRSYTRLATTIDQSVGTLLEALQASGADSNTIVIYTSDHGYSLGEFSLCEKHYAYEQIMRIPMIVRFPEHQLAGSPPEDMVLGIDIAPTLMDYCTGRIPSDMEGQSWKILQEHPNRKKPFREEFFFDFWHNQAEILPPMQAIRTPRYKLIQYEYQAFQELYDLEKDPHEKINRIDDPAYSEILTDLEKRMDHWKHRTHWSSRSNHPLQRLYVATSVPNKPETELLQPNRKDLKTTRGCWKLMEGESGNFPMKSYADAGDFYVAIPYRNLSPFDPFVSFRVHYADRKRETPPFIAYYQGKAIYMNYPAKVLLGKQPVVKEEASLRRGFDLGYNPPLPTGNGVIVLKFLKTSTVSPPLWHFNLIGGLNYLSF